MKAVLLKMDASEHCPECGALLIKDGGVSICAACGYYGCKEARERSRKDRTADQMARRIPSTV